MERLKMMARDVQDLDGTIHQALPSGDGVLRIAPVAEPLGYVEDTGRLVRLSRAKKHEPRAHPAGSGRTISSQQMGVHLELGLHQATDVCGRVSSIQACDGFEERIRKGDVIQRTRRIDKYNALHWNALCQ